MTTAPGATVPTRAGEASGDSGAPAGQGGQAGAAAAPSGKLRPERTEFRPASAATLAESVTRQYGVSCWAEAAETSRGWDAASWWPCAGRRTIDSGPGGLTTPGDQHAAEGQVSEILRGLK